MTNPTPNTGLRGASLLAMNPKLDHALGELFAAVSETSTQGTRIDSVAGSRVEGLGDELEPLQDAFAALSKRSARSLVTGLAASVEVLLVCRRHLLGALPEAANLTDEDQLRLAAAIPGTFVMGLGLVTSDPDKELMTSAKSLSESLASGTRSVGRPLDPLEAAWFLGRHLADD